MIPNSYSIHGWSVHIHCCSRGSLTRDMSDLDVVASPDVRNLHVTPIGRPDETAPRLRRQDGPTMVRTWNNERPRSIPAPAQKTRTSPVLVKILHKSLLYIVHRMNRTEHDNISWFKQDQGISILNLDCLVQMYVAFLPNIPQVGGSTPPEAPCAVSRASRTRAVRAGRAASSLPSQDDVRKPHRRRRRHLELAAPSLLRRTSERCQWPVPRRTRCFRFVFVRTGVDVSGDRRGCGFGLGDFLFLSSEGHGVYRDIFVSFFHSLKL